MAVSLRPGRKGVFFTIMALLIVAFLLASEKAGTTPLTVTFADTTAAQSRVSVMNAYINTFETQAANSLAAAGYFTLQNLSNRVQRSGTYFSPTTFNTTIDNCVRTQPQLCMLPNQTLTVTLNNLTDIARTNLSIATTYTVERVWVTEENPFEVLFWMNISYSVSDQFANWTFTNVTISAPVDVSGITDPAYAYSNASNATGTPRKFVRGQYRARQFTNTTFFAYYSSQSYIVNKGTNNPGEFYFGPSVLQRYTGRLMNGSACCGIESMVNYLEINATIRADPRMANWSHVDYLFFSRENITPFNCQSSSSNGSVRMKAGSIPAPHDRIRLDNYHAMNTYWNLTNHTQETCSIS